jgi:hypothetical protein
MNNLEIVYTFEDRQGGTFVYPLRMDRKTVSLVSDAGVHPPAWTGLANCQCQVCPLTPEKNPFCPIAVNINGLVAYFQDFYSTDVMRITVTTEARTYVKEASAQTGLASIFGAIMATSGCPVMNFLKPMAKFHLPFATAEETVIRSTSMYLLAQYFVCKRGGKPDISLDRLARAYADVLLVNEGMSRRIGTVVRRKDATNNAIIILHTLTQLLDLEIDKKLDSLQSLFEGIEA